MSNISMVEAKLPPGFRFHPRDEELICDYLMIKVSHDHDHHLRRCHDSPILIEVDLNKSEPWDLPELACVGGKDWYFYSQRDRKYATGLRTNRATATGYWKATGKDRPIHRRGSLVGMRKTLVFYQGRAPKGSKTDWVMHEFRLEGPFGPPQVSITKEDWVLCRMFYKNKDSPSKSSMESSYDTIGTTMTSLSLPPLTDSYINFKTNQTGPNTTNICHNDYNHQEQVPCFSIFPTHHTNQTAPNNHIFSSHGFMTNMDHHQLPNTTMAPNKNNMVMMASDASFGGGGAMVGMGGGGGGNGNGNGDPFSRDKKVIKAVLDQYFKMESDNNIGGAMKESPTSLGGGDSFLSEVGMSNMLNLY